MTTERSHDLKFDKGTIYIVYFHANVHVHTSSQAKGTNSTSFLTHVSCVRNEVELVPLACEDDVHIEKMGTLSKSKIKLYICDNKLRSCAQFAPWGKSAPGCSFAPPNLHHLQRWSK